MNICDYILKNNIPHIKLEDGRIQQVGLLFVVGAGITSLDGLVQTNQLHLINNRITNIPHNFVQTDIIFLHNNRITSLDNFIQRDVLDLNNNPIPNSNNTFKNPKTGRIVLKMNDNWFGCGCFLGTKKDLKKTCVKQGFKEIIEYFKL